MSDNRQTPKPYRSHLEAVPSEHDSTYEIKVSGWINHCQELAVNQADLLCDAFLELTEEKLSEQIGKATTNQFGTEAIQNLNEFRQKSDKIKLYLGDQVNVGFDKFKRKELNTHLNEDSDDAKEGWSLVDDRILEESIAIKTISHDAHLEFSEELWKLDKRFSSINSGEFVSEHNNPLSPLQFCIALKAALNVAELSVNTKLTAYKVFAGLIYTYLGPLYQTTNEYFSSEGILPNLRFEEGLTKSHYNAEKSVQENPYLSEQEESADSELGDSSTGSVESQQAELVSSIRQLMQSKRQAANPGGEGKPVPLSEISNKTYVDPNAPSVSAPILFINQQIIDAVDSVQTAQNDLIIDLQDSSPKQIIDTNILVADELAKKSASGQVDPQDMYTIDLVGILFEYILTDENLPDSVKAILSHLHTPFLKLAFIDTNFFEKPEHPARLLLDSLAEAGTNWVGDDDTSEYDMYNEIKAIVTRILREFKNDVRLFAETLFEFNRLKNKLTHRHQLKERNSVEKVQGQERLRLAKERAKKEIEIRTKSIKLPSAVIQLLKPWYTYLTLLQLRDTDNEALWKQALRVVDEVVYFFNFQNPEADRSELEPRFKGILTAIKIGFNTLSYDQAKTKKILVDLTALKIATVKRYCPEVSKVKPPTNQDEKATVSQIPILKAEPIKPREEEPTEEEAKVINYLKLIEPGTWFEFEGKTRFKVSGFSSKIMKYMLVDNTSQKVLMMTRLELAQKIIKGEAKVVAGSTKPLFERALERIFHHLESEKKPTPTPS